MHAHVMLRHYIHHVQRERHTYTQEKYTYTHLMNACTRHMKALYTSATHKNTHTHIHIPQAPYECMHTSCYGIIYITYRERHTHTHKKHTHIHTPYEYMQTSCEDIIYSYRERHTHTHKKHTFHTHLTMHAHVGRDTI
jgi:hypothetical protein